MSDIQQTQTTSSIYILMIFAVVLGLPVLPFAVAFFMFFKIIDVDWKIPAIGGVVIALLLTVTQQWGVYQAELIAYGHWAVSQLQGQQVAIPNYFHWIFFNLGGGYLVALAGILYQQFRNPITRQVEEDLALIGGASLKKEVSKRQIQKIAKSLHPQNAVLIGVDFDKEKPAQLTDQQLNGHVLLLGATGAGKTTTILNFVESAAQRGLGCVVIDAKGSPSTLARIEALASKYGRDLRVFETREGKGQAWNPLTVGDPAELRDKLIALFDFSEPYYQNLAKEYLLNVFSVWSAMGERPNLAEFVECLDPRAFKQRVRASGAEIDLEQYLGDTDSKDLQGIIKPLRDLVQSLPNKFTDGFSLFNSITRGEIVVFSLEILRYPELVPRLGRLLTLDLRTAAVRLLGSEQRTYVILDEFGAFANDQIVNVINQTREAGFCNVISTQSLSDFDRISPTLKKLVLANCNSYIIQRQNESDDAEDCAKTFGTEMKATVTHQTDAILGATGAGTVSMQRDFKVSPDAIKELRTGEAFIMSKLPPEFLAKVKIREVTG